MAEKKQDRNDEQTGAIIRRRLIGAAAMLLFAFVLWHLGESAPPEQVNIPAPQAEEWQTPKSEVLENAETRLADGDAVLENLDDVAGDDGGYDDGGAFAGDDNVFVSDEVDDVEVVVDNNDEVDNADDNNNEVENGENDTPSVAVAKPSTKPAIVESDNTNTGISFSAGVFANPKNAEALAAKINAAGWQTTIDTYQKDDKTLHKILVVNLADDNAKDKAKAAVEKLVNVKTPQAQTSKFVVQVGAFENPSKAKVLVQKLKDDGYTANISKTNRDGTLLHRVRIIGYQTRADAEEVKRNLHAADYVKAQVIDLR